MTKKTSFDFGGSADVEAAVDRFAPPDATGKLKKLRASLLEVLPDKKNLTAVEAAELISFSLFSAELTKDEIDYAVTRLFVSNEYFKDMVRGIVESKMSAYPSLTSDSGESVYVGSAGAAVDEPVEASATDFAKSEEDATVTVVTEVADEGHTVILTTEDATYQEIQESNDKEVTAEVTEEVTAKVVEEVAQDVVDFGEMSIKELKVYASDNGIDLTGLTKKPEIVAKLIEETQARGEY